MATVTIERRAQVIVLGNEKGGSGKSTAAMHIAVGLLRDGHRVGAIDLDARQATLSGYLAARAAFADAKGIAPHCLRGIAVPRSDKDSRAEAEAEEASRFAAALADLSQDCDVVVIDCPGRRHVPQPAWPRPRGYAGDADQRQLCRFRHAGEGRSGPARRGAAQHLK